jgi:hypothetical protein
MNVTQNLKVKSIVNPISINGATGTILPFDLQSGGPYQELMFVIQIGAIAADMTTLQIIEQDTTFSAGGGSTSVVTGCTFTAPTTATEANTIYTAYVPLGARKRFVGVQITAGAGATVVSACAIGVPGVMPNSDTERGTQQSKFGT